MAIRTVRSEEHAEFVAFSNAGMRPETASTRVEEDFPVAFSPGNLHGLWGERDEVGWVAGLAVLTRTLATSSGEVRAAGIGSVVTRADRRGEGLSARLQAEVLARLAAMGVPLAVLWSDRPEIYAGRGFQPAGWEYHLDLADLRPTDLRTPPVEVRALRPEDFAAIGRLYGRHPLRTLREPGDDALLYGMPGTRGLVMAAGGDVLAYAFCGKGEDFPGYVAEWGGEAPLALAVIAAVLRRGLAKRVLVPAGREDLLAAAAALGARYEIWPSGLWKVLRPDLLPVGRAARPTGDTANDARTWLGRPGPDGLPVRGNLDVAIWGLDSV